MIERPILMTPENAQKCHEGTKTQMRRSIKPQPLGISWFEHQQGWCARVREDMGSAEHPAYVMMPCPYGKVGDRLWVREAWAFPGEEALMYRGNPEDVALYKKWMKGENYPKITWTPSIHMPRWACRTVLEITRIRVERLQEISEQDALAEGVRVKPDAEIAARVARETPARMEYWALWESINGAGSWALNPWVWVLTFRRVKL